MNIEERISAAIDRLAHGNAPMRVPVDETDADVVLAACEAEIGTLRTRIRELEAERDEALEHVCQAHAAGNFDCPGCLEEQRDHYREAIERVREHKAAVDAWNNFATFKSTERPKVEPADTWAAVCDALGTEEAG